MADEARKRKSGYAEQAKDASRSDKRRMSSGGTLFLDSPTQSNIQMTDSIAVSDTKTQCSLLDREKRFASRTQQHNIAQLASNGVFSAGNYSSYYSKRLPPGSRDPRIDIMKREWFENKSCLDIGCNVGLVSIEFIRTLGASKVRAVDIDNSLILRARAAAKNVPLPGNEKLARELLGVPWVPISFRLSIGALKTVAHSISFECEDYVATEDCTVEEYDVITCLSTIKWVHLNNGDAGVQKLFHKAFKSLRSGGVFILEPQPWKSYRKSRLLTPQIKAQFVSIKLKPVDFEHYLVEKIGFARIETISNNSGCKESGFATSHGQQRSIYACFKD